LDTGKKCREYFDGEIFRKVTKWYHRQNSVIIEMEHVEIGCDDVSRTAVAESDICALMLVMLKLEILLPGGCTSVDKQL
jgi:hypothetical protein